MNKRIIAVFASLILIFSLAVPAFAFDGAGARHATPAGYNDHDYQKIAAFLDTEATVTYFGMTMTKHLYEWAQMLDPNFSMQDPTTWHVEYDGATQVDVQWTRVGGEYRLQTVWADPTITWFTDYTGCDLDLSDCTELVTLVANVFRLGALDVSGCVKLANLQCRNNNTLAAVDLEGCQALSSVDLTNCLLTMIDFSDSPLMPFRRISANGRGTVGFAGSTAIAKANSGSQFLGWYSESGQLITNSLQLDASSTNFTRVSARFSGAVVTLPGDADGNGVVNVTDALTVLRATMGLIPMTPAITSACDVNHDGAVNMTDSLLILRFSMGLIPEL